MQTDPFASIRGAMHRPRSKNIASLTKADQGSKMDKDEAQNTWWCRCFHGGTVEYISCAYVYLRLLHKVVYEYLSLLTSSSTSAVVRSWIDLAYKHTCEAKAKVSQALYSMWEAAMQSPLATHVSWCLLVCYNLIVENLEFGYNSVMPSNTTHRRLMQVTTLLLAMMGLAAFHKDTIHSELSYISFKHPVQVGVAHLHQQNKFYDLVKQMVELHKPSKKLSWTTEVMDTDHCRPGALCVSHRPPFPPTPPVASPPFPFRPPGIPPWRVPAEPLLYPGGSTVLLGDGSPESLKKLQLKKDQTRADAELASLSREVKEARKRQGRRRHKDEEDAVPVWGDARGGEASEGKPPRRRRGSPDEADAATEQGREEYSNKFSDEKASAFIQDFENSRRKTGRGKRGDKFFRGSASAYGPSPRGSGEDSGEVLGRSSRKQRRDKMDMEGAGGTPFSTGSTAYEKGDETASGTIMGTSVIGKGLSKMTRSDKSGKGGWSKDSTSMSVDQDSSESTKRSKRRGEMGKDDGLKEMVAKQAQIIENLVDAENRQKKNAG
mmetsp:Transcript_24783/g.46968  ORF Transcript_24783/g.46968 Transcript_24783/m.46968 type:complete len:548 (-) Transcript_24783:239-1882(-)